MTIYLNIFSLLMKHMIISNMKEDARLSNIDLLTLKLNINLSQKFTYPYFGTQIVHSLTI